MNRKPIGVGLAMLACLGALGALQLAGAQPARDPWYGRQANPKNIDRPTSFAGTFSIELPKNWQLAPGHTGTLFTTVEKTRGNKPGALIALEYMRLQAPLEPSLMAAASERELKETQARELSGKGFTTQVKNGVSGPFILIQYERPGLLGGADHVVQYSLPSGTTMYRLICVAPAGALDKYQPLFAHVAASFTPLKPSGR